MTRSILVGLMLFVVVGLYISSPRSEPPAVDETVKEEANDDSKPEGLADRTQEDSSATGGSSGDSASTGTGLSNTSNGQSGNTAGGNDPSNDNDETVPPVGCNGLFNVPGGANQAGACWPGPENTGIPAGTVLTDYTGCGVDDTVITTDNAIVDSKTINCHVVIRAANVTIKKTRINGIIILDPTAVGADDWSLALEDSEVNGGQIEQFAAVSDGNITILRSHIYGALHNVHCFKDCEIRDSYLHTPYAHGTFPNDSHNNAFISNGGSGFRLVHNTLACDTPVAPGGGGCSGDVSLFGDFAPVGDVTLDNNLFVANTGAAYCLYGGYQSNKPFGQDAHDIRVTNNIFQRGINNNCGDFGPVTNFTLDGDSNGPVAPGNIWTNNRWDDGTLLIP